MRQVRFLAQGVDDQRVYAPYFVDFPLVDLVHVGQVGQRSYPEAEDRQLVVDAPDRDDPRLSDGERLVGANRMQVDFRNAGVGMLRERIVEVLPYPLLDPFLGIELHRSAGSVVECPHVVQSADMVLMLVGQQNSVESFHARPQHLLPEIRARVDQDRFAARLDQGRRSQPLVPLVRRQA